MNEEIFLGHPLAYWIELEKRARVLNVVHLLEELTAAHGKIGFYEKRIREMNTMIAQ